MLRRPQTRSARPFVGRRAELDRFQQILADPRGQALLVVGQQGMGKTFLVNEMASQAGTNPALRCGAVRYEVTETDTVDSTLELMIDHAFDAAGGTERMTDATEHRRQMWRSALNIITGLGIDIIQSARNVMDEEHFFAGCKAPLGAASFSGVAPPSSVLKLRPTRSAGGSP